MKIINLNVLEKNISNIENHHETLKSGKNKERMLREYTYLTTYPEIIDFSKISKLDDIQYFKMLALMTYGWMPRVLRIDDEYLTRAAAELSKAKVATNKDYEGIKIQLIADCLHSLVGASKMLHFTNPEVFPIWDSKIQYNLTGNNNQNAMKKLDNYNDYIKQVYILVKNKHFDSFFRKYNLANQKRLENIIGQPYDVTPIRAIEASLFEMK